MCDVQQNVEEGKENIYEPNLFFHATDAENNRMIRELITMIRSEFNPLLDDNTIFKEIILKLNFDIHDIHAYLSCPIENERMIY
jgi:hypothetical protein